MPLDAPVIAEIGKITPEDATQFQGMVQVYGNNQTILDNNHSEDYNKISIFGEDFHHSGFRYRKMEWATNANSQFNNMGNIVPTCLQLFEHFLIIE